MTTNGTRFLVKGAVGNHAHCTQAEENPMILIPIISLAILSLAFAVFLLDGAVTAEVKFL